MDRYAKIFSSWGINPTVSRVYFTIFLSTEPLGLKEISDETGYSVSTVSNVMEILERMTDIRRFKKPGSKKIYYECQHDFLLVQKKKFQQAYGQMHAVKGLFKESEEKLQGEDDPESVKVRGYMKQAYDDLQKVEELLAELRKSIEDAQRSDYEE